MGPVDRWVQTVGDQPNILPLDLNFYLLLFSFHHRSVYRACFIVIAQLPIESDSYNIPLCFETDSLIFWASLLSENHIDYTIKPMSTMYSLKHTGR